MGVSITNELCVFLVTVVAGILSGVICDLFKVIGKKGIKSFAITVSDIFMALTVCSLVVSVFYFYNSFCLRWYMFIGLFLGVIFYFTCISSLVVFLVEKIFALFHFILKILLTPARFLYKILLVCLFMPMRAFMNILIEKMNKRKIDRGIKKNEAKNKKKHKNKRRKANHNSAAFSSVVFDGKGDNAPT